VAQKLKSCGDKKKQARQLNAVVKVPRTCLSLYFASLESYSRFLWPQGSSAYIERVQSAFEKNFDKFELYVRRNIVMVPMAVADRVEQLYSKRLEDSAAAASTGGASTSGSSANPDDAHLSPQERREKQLEDELRALRLQIRQLEEDTQQMTLEYTALETKAQQFQDVAAKLEFLDQIATTTISPLKRTVEHVTALQQSLDKMEGVQIALEDDTRAFKRQKMGTRDTYHNLRQRFTARTATVAFASLDDLKQLNATLSGA
jgi:chromosome segregation ATPase